ncbi:MAG: glycoside hydrolase family 172 protein [Phycisphaerales bacterium]
MLVIAGVLVRLALLSTAVAAPSAPPITTGTLVSELADLGRLTRFPAGVRVVQFSSYDRRSSVPGGADWFANSDGFGGEPIPGFEATIKPPEGDGVLGTYLVCDVQQPGAIVRTWSAGMVGTIRVSLDGAAAPVFDGPAEDFLRHRAAKLIAAANLDKALVDSFEQRYADYFPIPFAKSCRIEWTGDIKQLHFYHVQVRLYPKETPISTFTAESVRDAASAIADLAPRMRPGASGPDASAWTRVHESLVPGATKELCAIEGPAAIESLEVKVDADDVAAALRGTVLRIAFDGAAKPQVVAPIGDFFGAAPGVVPFETLPMRVDPNGTMRCRFVMPFRSRAVISVENQSPSGVAVALGLVRSAYEWRDDSMHFHAGWRADQDLLARGGKSATDMPYLFAESDGGVYVGSSLFVMNPCPVPTAGGNWWGEGDEKVFVDGERRPSIFGTGSEDYFNYAWSESDIFAYPYFAQPICTGPDTRGYIANNRWHIVDAIPFERSIAFFIELFAHTPTPHLAYDRIAYWYARPGGFDDCGPLNGSDLRVPPLLPWTVLAEGGARGATMFEAETVADGRAETELLESVRYSAGKAVRFTGTSAALRLRVATAGKYRLVFTCSSGPEPSAFAAQWGTTRLTRERARRFELHTPYFERLVNVWCDPIDLEAGDQTLLMDSIEGHPIVDFVWLKPVK